MRAARSAGLLAALLFATAAGAQSLAPRTLFVDDEGAELFDTEAGEGGIRAGSFDVRLAAGVSFGYDTNVYATDGDEVNEGLATGEALLRASDKSETRDITGLAFVRARRYDTARDQDATEFGALGRYDGWLGPQDRLTTRFSAERNVESRTDIETPTDLDVSLFDDFRASFGHAHVFNRFTVDSRLDARRVQYEEDSQQFRDRNQYRGELRGAYQFRAGTAWVLSGYYNRDAFDDDSVLSLSADTVGGLLGLRFDLNDLLQLEIGAGYFERRYDDGPAPFDGISARAALDWHPTRLTTVRAQLLRSDAPTRVEGAVAKIRNEARFEIEHEWSRTLLFTVGARYVQDDFDLIDRKDRAWLTELGANWSFGRHSVLRFSYDYAARDQSTFGRSFERHVATLAYIGRL
ncbi:MAG TPA: outer membrane beta-barrel protein [Steroidobacteraceae bacterium]|nr:outer membrane beta-barrel protein [Steroidobacteraceae bacterium]